MGGILLFFSHETHYHGMLTGIIKVWLWVNCPPPPPWDGSGPPSPMGNAWKEKPENQTACLKAVQKCSAGS